MSQIATMAERIIAGRQIQIRTFQPKPNKSQPALIEPRA